MAGTQTRRALLEFASPSAEAPCAAPALQPGCAAVAPISVELSTAIPDLQPVGRPRQVRPTATDFFQLDPLLVCARKAELFAGLSIGEWTEIASASKPGHLIRRETLFRQGETAGSVSVLCSGRMKETQLSQDGAEVIVKVISPGEAVGELGSPANGLRSTTAQALTLCALCLSKVHEFGQLSQWFPKIQRNATRIMADYLTGLEERFRELATERVPTRLALTLIRLLEPFGIPVLALLP